MTAAIMIHSEDGVSYRFFLFLFILRNVFEYTFAERVREREKETQTEKTNTEYYLFSPFQYKHYNL